ncbi:MAG: hypothetical protein CM1200mP33_6500 [Chloroflexota bacterium]|nr:MAG: hypothetical protein CM1200mP33_6500 [Chloroflexota bacterium]
MNEFDTIIIGGGIAGSSAAFHLSKKPKEKILLNKILFLLGHQVKCWTNWVSGFGGIFLI